MRGFHSGTKKTGKRKSRDRITAQYHLNVHEDEWTAQKVAADSNLRLFQKLWNMMPHLILSRLMQRQNLWLHLLLTT